MSEEKERSEEKGKTERGKKPSGSQEKEKKESSVRRRGKQQKETSAPQPPSTQPEQTVYERGDKFQGVNEKDRKNAGQLTEKMLQSAVGEAMKAGVEVNGKKIQAEDFDRLKALLFRKKEVDEEEEKSLLELLLALLQFLYEQIKQAIFGDKDDHKAIVETAKAFGIGDDSKEIMKWVTSIFTFSEEGEAELQKNVDRYLADEQDVPVPDEQMLEAWRKRGWTEGDIQRVLKEGKRGGTSGPADGEDIDVMIDAMSDDEVARIAARGDRTLATADIWQQYFAQSRQGDQAVSLNPLQATLDEQVKRLKQAQEIGDQAREKHLQREVAKSILLLERMAPARKSNNGEDVERQMGLYGPRAVDLMRRITELRKVGVYAALTAREADIRAIQIEGDTGDSLKVQTGHGEEIFQSGESEVGKKLLRDVALVQAGNLSVDEFRESLRVNYIKPVYEEVIGDAEEDPRQGFKMESWGHILMGELFESVKEAGYYGDREKQRLSSSLYARQISSLLNADANKGASITDMHKKADQLFLSEDYDTMMRTEPGLGAARRRLEAVFSLVQMDPNNRYRMPYKEFIADPEGNFEAPHIQRMVSETLLQQQGEGILRNSLDQKVSIKRKEAARIAGQAMSVSNSMLRTTERMSTSLLAPREGGEFLISTPHDKARYDTLRMSGERFETYGRGREAIKPLVDRMRQAVQPGVYEPLPGNGGFGVDRWELNPENLFKIGGNYSASHWRAHKATEQQRARGLALGLKLYEPDANKADLWRQVGERLPTVVARYFPTLALENAKDKIHYFDFEARLRSDVISGGEKESFLRYVQTRRDALLKDKKEDHLGEISSEITKDIESRILRGVSKDTAKNKEDLKKAVAGFRASGEYTLDGKLGRVFQEKVEQRQRELYLQEGARISFLWMVAKETGTEMNLNTPEWEGKAWERWVEIENKLAILQEKKLQEFLFERKEEYQDADGIAQSAYDAGHDASWRILDDPTLTEGVKNVVRRLTFLGNNDISERDYTTFHQQVLGLSDEEINTELDLHDDYQVSSSNREAKRNAVLWKRLDKEKKRGAERLASVEFSFTPFLDDVAHEKEEWKEIGPRGVSRRYADNEMYQNAQSAFWKISNNLMVGDDRAPQDRAELVKNLTEFQNIMQYLSESDRQKITASLAYNVVNNLYKADKWTNIPFFGPVIDWGGPWGLWKFAGVSSPAQRKFGYDAMSMTALERYQFINDLRPLIGNEWADKLMKDTKSRFRNVVYELVNQYSLPGAIASAWYLAKPFFTELAAYMKQDFQ